LLSFCKQQKDAVHEILSGDVLVALGLQAKKVRVVCCCCAHLFSRNTTYAMRVAYLLHHGPKYRVPDDHGRKNCNMRGNWTIWERLEHRRCAVIIITVSTSLPVIHPQSLPTPL
jgi:hypothetical protein